MLLATVHDAGRTGNSGGGVGGVGGGLMGRVVVPAVAAWEAAAEAWLPLLDGDGRPLYGAGGRPSAVCLRYAYEENDSTVDPPLVRAPEPAPAPPLPAAASEEPARAPVPRQEEERPALFDQSAARRGGSFSARGAAVPEPPPAPALRRASDATGGQAPSRAGDLPARATGTAAAQPAAAAPPSEAAAPAATTVSATDSSQPVGAAPAESASLRPPAMVLQPPPAALSSPRLQTAAIQPPYSAATQPLASFWGGGGAGGAEGTGPRFSRRLGGGGLGRRGAAARGGAPLPSERGGRDASSLALAAGIACRRRGEGFLRPAAAGTKSVHTPPAHAPLQ